MPRFSSITTKLLTIVFSFYLIIAVTVTLLHVFAEYNDSKQRIGQELERYFEAFVGGVVLAIWDLDKRQLTQSAEGALNVPSVSGIKITGQNGIVLKALGTYSHNDKISGNKLFWFEGPIIYRGPDSPEPVLLGTLTLYSNNQLVLDRVWLSLTFIIINAIIKTLALWVIFIWVGRALIKTPLLNLTWAAKKFDFNNLQESKIHTSYKDQDEFKALQDSFNEMIDRLQMTKNERDEAEAKLVEYNKTLQEKVEERTIEIEETLRRQEKLNADLIRKTIELNKANSKLKFLATTDSLTRFRNRHEFMNLASKELSRAQRYHRNFSLMMLDIDHFKSVNDNYGHAAGDLVLSQFADICRGYIREQDIIGRIGGEEFVMLLPETNEEEATVLAERIRIRVAETNFDTQSGVLNVTVSIGVVEAIPEEESIDAALYRADQALYYSKDNGRNQVTRYVEIQTA